MNKSTIILLCKIALFLLIFMSAISHVVAESAPKKLQIGVKKRPSECPIKSKKGDLLHMHYTVTTITYFSYHVAHRHDWFINNFLNKMQFLQFN